jgi:hypothetical protein
MDAQGCKFKVIITATLEYELLLLLSCFKEAEAEIERKPTGPKRHSWLSGKARSSYWKLESTLPRNSLSICSVPVAILSLSH